MRVYMLPLTWQYVYCPPSPVSMVNKQSDLILSFVSLRGRGKQPFSNLLEIVFLLPLSNRTITNFIYRTITITSKSSIYHIGNVIVSVPASSVVDHWFKPRSGKNKYKISICCFPVKNTT